MRVIFKSLLTDSAGRLIPQIIQLLMSIYFARILPVEAFGQLAFLVSASAIAQTIAEFNLPNFIVYNQSYGGINRYLIISSSIYLVLASIAIISFEEILQFWWFIIFFGLLNLLLNYIRSVYYLKSMIFAFNSRFVISVTFSSIVFYLIGLKFNDSALILIYNLFSLSIMTLVSIKNILTSEKERENILYLTQKEIEYIKGFYFANLFNVAGSNAENIVLKKLIGVSSLGFFNRAKSIESIATTSGLQSMSYVFFSKLSEFNLHENSAGQKQQISLALLLFCLLGLMFGIFIYFFGPLLVLFVYGEDYKSSSELVRLLAFIVPTQFLYTWLNMVLSVKGKGVFFAKINVIKTFLLMASLISLIYFRLEYYIVVYSLVFFLLTFSSVLIYFLVHHESHTQNK
ncbi:oligosaccharide flippase family protein [Schleiferiaceae bacterium]|nr:oligosaccharide flippase family protein [Schleiferiaceae bacterium]